MRHPSFLIGAPSSGSGKTTITLGLMAAFGERGLKVQGFKVGPDYIDPGFHRLVTGRPSYNLDSWMGGVEEVRGRFMRHARDADITLIEGVMGLFDGVSSDSDVGSSAYMAELLRVPVILVVDISAMARSAAAVVKGFQVMGERIRLAGVILNRAGSVGHQAMVRVAIEEETGIPVMGYLQSDTTLVLPERHLGLVTAREATETVSETLAILSHKIVATMDLDAIVGVAESAEGPPGFSTVSPEPMPRLTSRAKVALAWDQAFNFYYPANLDLLTELGAELVPFSPVQGERIPRGATHLYVGGGFPEEYLKELASHPDVLKDFYDRIGPGRLSTLAECGGYMLLGEAIWSSEGDRTPMVGLIPVETEMTSRLQAFGYRQMTVLGDGVFPQGTVFRGHAYHHSRLRASEVEMTTGYDVASPRGLVAREGLGRAGLLAGYSHLYLPSAPDAVAAWLHRE